MDRVAHSRWFAKDVARLLALVENERRYYAEIIADLPVAIAIVSSGQELLLTNRAFRSLFQLKATEIQSLRLGGLQSGEAIAAQVCAAFASNQAVDSITTGAFQISLTPFRGTDEPGQEILLVVQPGVVQASREPSEFDIAEYDAIFWRRNGDLNFEFVSPQIEEILGYTADQFIADPEFWLGTIHPGDRPTVQDFYRNIQEDGRHRIEYRASNARGQRVRLRDTVRVASGRMSGMTFDVTNQALVQNDHLQSEKFESLSRVARRMVHDFNNLHMVIQGFGGEVLAALPPDGSAQGDMEEILGAASRLSAAVEKLDVYIRRPALVLAPFDINRFVEKFLSGLSLPKGVETSLDLQPAAALVQGDAENIGKILSWVLTLDAGGHVRVATGCMRASEVHADKTSALGPGDYTVLSVANSGTPLDQVAVESVLLRAHTVMRLMGGGFDVSSDGSGNTFQLLLPSALKNQLEASKPIAPAASALPVTPKTILVVEDESGIRMLIRKMLLRQGYQVLDAESGPKGLNIAVANAGKIDLLITDLMMPVMNGRELVDRMLKSWPLTKVLFVSGFTDDPLLDRKSLPAGVGFLQKPFTLESLLEKVSQTIGSAL
jgi:two-component system cell cycle sensor histidine kinase/response regulator CckA